MSRASSAKAPKGGAAHTDKLFEQELRALRERLLMMGSKVELAIAESLRALTEREQVIAERVVRQDAAVNRLEVEIDNLCQRILALRQPAASDLRLITTALKIVTDLERIGDLAVNIAKRVMELNQSPPLHEHGDLIKLAELAQAQMKQALDAFVESDADAAEAVVRGDDHLDALFLQIFNGLLAFMMEDSKNIRRGTALVSIAKYLERVGDHAMNVAEMVIYMVRGTDIRHPRSRALVRG